MRLGSARNAALQGWFPQTRLSPGDPSPLPRRPLHAWLTSLDVGASHRHCIHRACNPPRDFMVRLLAILIRSMTLLLSGSASLALAWPCSSRPRSSRLLVFSPQRDSLNLDFRPGRDNPSRLLPVDRESGRCELKALARRGEMGIDQRLALARRTGDSEIVGQCHALAAERGRHGVLGTCSAPQVGRHDIDESGSTSCPRAGPAGSPTCPGRSSSPRGTDNSTATASTSSAGRVELIGYAAPGRAGRLRASKRSPGNARPPARAPCSWRTRLAEPSPPPPPALRGPELQGSSGRQELNGPPQPWWLQMSRDGTEIEDAGPLCDSGRDRTMSHPHLQTLPDLAVDQARDGPACLPVAKPPGTGLGPDRLAARARPEDRPGPAPAPKAPAPAPRPGLAAVPPICTSDGAPSCTASRINRA